MSEGFFLHHRTFFKGEGVFYPNIGKGEGCNVTPICLSARLEDSLEWGSSVALARKEMLSGKMLFWEFDFGLASEALDLTDTGRFLSFTLAIDHFLKEILPEFQGVSFGVSLYQGCVDFASRFIWSGDHAEEWKGSRFQKEVYCTRVVGDYLHRLASCFPETLVACCLFDISSLSFCEAAYLLSKERFAYLCLGVKGGIAPLGELLWKETQICTIAGGSAVGVLLPEDVESMEGWCGVLEGAIADLVKNGKLPRVIPESLFNEQWDGLETVMVCQGGVSKRGKRMLEGFVAAGGVVEPLSPSPQL